MYGVSSLSWPSSSLTQPDPWLGVLQTPLQCLEVRGRSPSHLEPGGLQVTNLVSTPYPQDTEQTDQGPELQPPPSHSSGLHWDTDLGLSSLSRQISSST